MASWTKTLAISGWIGGTFFLRSYSKIILLFFQRLEAFNEKQREVSNILLERITFNKRERESERQLKCVDFVYFINSRRIKQTFRRVCVMYSDRKTSNIYSYIYYLFFERLDDELTDERRIIGSRLLVHAQSHVYSVSLC